MGDRDAAVKDLLRGAVEARECSLFGEFVILNVMDEASGPSAAHRNAPAMRASCRTGVPRNDDDNRRDHAASAAGSASARHTRFLPCRLAA